MLLPESFLGFVLCCESVSRRVASRRPASVFQSRLLWIPRAHVRKNVILNLRRVDMRRGARRGFAIVVSCGFRGSCLLPMLS
jgi:hypothetical protein